MIHSDQPDIILCQETKLDETISNSELFPDSYSVFRKDRDRKGGGVCIAVNKKLQAVECRDLDSDLEAIWISLQTSDRCQLYICSLYRPPDRDQEYIEALRKPLELLLKRHHNKPPHIIIAGDTNYRSIDWSTVSAPAVNLGGNFIDVLNDFYLQQLVDCPTRFCSTTSSLLDLVICSHPASVSNLVVGREISDHCMISFNVSFLAAAAESAPRRIFLYSKGNYDQLRSDIHLFSNSFFGSSPDSKSVNENWLDLKQAVTSSAHKNIPTKLVTGHSRHPSWLTPSVRRAIRRRDTLARAARRSGSQIARDRYRKARNIASNEVQRGYFSHLNAVIGNVKSDPRSFYRFI
jgi:hypothetical protein